MSIDPLGVTKVVLTIEALRSPRLEVTRVVRDGEGVSKAIERLELLTRAPK